MKLCLHLNKYACMRVRAYVCERLLEVCSLVMPGVLAQTFHMTDLILEFVF